MSKRINFRNLWKPEIQSLICEKIDDEILKNTKSKTRNQLDFVLDDITLNLLCFLKEERKFDSFQLRAFTVATINESFVIQNLINAMKASENEVSFIRKLIDPDIE